MQMTIYDAATVGSRSNCVYPNPVTVTDADTMRQAATFDHVCAAYKQNYRSIEPEALPKRIAEKTVVRTLFPETT